MSGSNRRSRSDPPWRVTRISLDLPSSYRRACCSDFRRTAISCLWQLMAKIRHLTFKFRASRSFSHGAPFYERLGIFALLAPILFFLALPPLKVLCPIAPFAPLKIQTRLCDRYADSFKSVQGRLDTVA